MSFDTTNNFDFVQSPSVSAIGVGKIPIDGSFDSEVTYEYLTNTAAINAGNANEWACYNGQETIFDVRIPPTNRIDFTKSYLRITGIANDTAVSQTAPVNKIVPIVPTPPPPALAYTIYNAVSIPWNTIAALLQTAEIQMNQSATLTEQITQNLGDGSMVKLLTNYTKDALDRASDQFFTPTIETTRDLTSGFSTETMEREDALTQVTPGTANYVAAPHCKNIMLSDLFDSVRIPAAFYLQNLQIKIRPKATDNILIQTIGDGIPGCIPRYFVTNIRLYLTMAKLTEKQLVLETNRIKDSTTPAVLRESFKAHDAIQKTYSVGASFRDSNIKNMQAAVFLFPSTLADDDGAGHSSGSNPYQYVYNYVTGYQQRYENIYSPATNMPVSSTLTTYALNSNLFSQYRLLCNKMSDREQPTALSFNDSMGVLAGSLVDRNPYVLFCSQFYPLTTASHKVMAGADHEIMTAGGRTGTVVIVRIRTSFLELRGDTSVYVIN
jgi:hypothetical protein